ncbi:GDSL-type esterase/lipase family protein [Pseudonocardia saturnea]
MGGAMWVERPGRRAANVLRGLVAAAGLICLLGAFALSGPARSPATVDVASAPAPDCAPAWAPAWRAAAQPAPADPALAGRTLRMVVVPQVTGSQVRVRLSNAYGSTPMQVGTVSAAWSDGAAGLVPGTMRPVAFAGQPAVSVAPGAEVVSDPVALVSEAGRPLAVSIFLTTPPDVLTQHGVALRTSYLSRPGDAALSDDGAAFDTPVTSWLVLTGVETLAPRPVNAVVTIGDSITDGVGAGAEERWSDALAARLTAAGGPSVMSVLNAGISRNQLLTDAPLTDGDSPLARYDRDVAGATDVVLHIGTNDIAAGRSADDIVAGMVRFAERARAAGTRVVLTTITPSTSGAHGTPEAVAVRDAVNAWVLAHGAEHADGVADFGAAVADPAQPAHLAPVYDSGDGLHLSAAGYRALADALDPALLTGSPCLDGSPSRVLVSAS